MSHLDIIFNEGLNAENGHCYYLKNSIESKIWRDGFKCKSLIYKNLGAKNNFLQPDKSCNIKGEQENRTICHTKITP